MNLQKVKAAGNGEQLATWTDMRSSYCRLHILQHEYVVPVKWRIQRIFAWIDGTAQRDRLFPEDLDTAKIEIRGLPKSRLTLFAGAFAYTVDLNTRGAATTELRTDQLRDILNDQQSSEVSLDLLLDDEKWSFGTFMRWPETTGDKTPPKANVSMSRHARPSAPTATLIKNMIKEPPRYLDRETLFRLATTQPGMLKHHNERQLKAVWYPLARIAVAHQVQHRVQSVGWSPSHMQRSFLSRKTDSTFSLLESERRNPKFELVMISAAGYRSVHNEWKQCLNAGGFRLQSFVSLQNWASS